MNEIQDSEYISRTGLRAGVGHPQDDPYVGRPRSAAGLAVMQDEPVCIAWKYNGREIRKNFDSGIQAVLDQKSNLLIVIGHGGSPIGEYDLPNNGVVFNPDGSVYRRIIVPPRITRPDVNKVLAPGSTRILVPEALTLVRKIDQGIEIFLAYLDGDWNEQRLYDPKSGEWGATTGQYRLV